jgi:hypothetical membrane protein
MTALHSTTHPSAPAIGAGSGWSRRLALGAIAGPVLFTAGWLLLGFISPGYTISGTWISPYSPITQPISGLGLGETGPYMNAVFIISGLLLLAGVVGVVRSLPAGGRPPVRWASAVLLAFTPIGLVVIGLFDLEKPAMHLLGAMMILATPVLSFLITGLRLRGLPGWRRFGTALVGASPLTLLLFVVYTRSFDQTAVAAGHGVAGLTQRILFVELLTWFVAMGVLARRATR